MRKTHRSFGRPARLDIVWAMAAVVLLGPGTVTAQVPSADAKAAAQLAKDRRVAERDALLQARAFASSVSCMEGPEVRLITLTPRGPDYDWIDETYLAYWNGDLGCRGGSRTGGTIFAIVRAGAGNSHHVDVLSSEPVAEFESPVWYVEKLISHTSDSVTFEGEEHKPTDSTCCPSLKVRFTLEVDAKGNWRLKDRVVLGTIKYGEDEP